jgi:dihydroorotate dehydrogenase
MQNLYPLFRPLLFAADPERAHDLVLRALDAAERTGLARLGASALAATPVTAMGIRFPNGVGLAAGLDKNAEHLRGLASLGFGFLEAGTVTPRAQPGNPRPRMFRLPSAQAIVNRLGFNNEASSASSRMSGAPGTAVSSGSTSARTSTRPTGARPTITSRVCAPFTRSPAT